VWSSPRRDISYQILTYILPSVCMSVFKDCECSLCTTRDNSRGCGTLWRNSKSGLVLFTVPQWGRRLCSGGFFQRNDSASHLHTFDSHFPTRLMSGPIPPLFLHRVVLSHRDSSPSLPQHNSRWDCNRIPVSRATILHKARTDCVQIEVVTMRVCLHAFPRFRNWWRDFCGFELWVLNVRGLLLECLTLPCKFRIYSRPFSLKMAVHAEDF